MNFFISLGRKSRQNRLANGRQARRFVPTSVSAILEARQLMAAGPLGINLAGTLGYVDLMKETRAWTSLTSSALALDSNGWPLGDAQDIVLDERLNQPWNGPDANGVQPDIGGTYHLSFSGQATVTGDWLNNFTVQNQTYNAVTNTTTADLVVPHNGLPMLYLDFRNTVNPLSVTGAGVANVKLIQPGYTADTTQVFTTNMLNDIAPFGTVRYLNIDSANNYPLNYDATGHLIPVEWSQRRLPSAASQTSGPGQPGQAWENMIAFANATNTDMWINIPAGASNDYVTKLATLFKYGDVVNGVTYAGLNSNLKVYLEYSNEVWGGTYLPYAYNLEAAKEQVAAGDTTLNNDGTTNQGIWAQRYYLEHTMQLTNLFRNVLGADPTYAKIRPVLGWGEGNWQYYTSTLPWFEATFGAPSQYFYGMGNANYANSSDYSTVDHMFASLNNAITAEYALTQNYAAIATYYGMNVVAYEGGPDTSGAQNAPQGQVALATSRDPRMETYIQQLYTAWYAAGGGLAMAYDGPYDNFTPNNQYSLLEVAQAANPTASPKYRGVVDVTQATAQPVTVGTSVQTGSTVSLPISDSLGTRFPAAVNSMPNLWLLNVATPGNYVLSVQTANGSATGRVAVSTSDTAQLGTVVVGSGTTTVLATLTLHAGLNTVSIADLASFTPTSLTLTPAPTAPLNDTGFENTRLTIGPSGYLYDPTGNAWSYTGYAGLAANNSAFTSGNPVAPQGTQVAFVQNQGTISQATGSLVAGTYHLTFMAAQRANFGTGPQTFQIVVDGTVVGTFSPVGGTYQTLATNSFPVTAGSHTIMFKGLNGVGDATAFVDAVALIQDSTTSANTATFGDPSFEQASMGSGFNAYLYNPTGTPWTYTGSAGVSGNGSAFTSQNPVAPAGGQVAFLQNLGSISQTLTGFIAGNYHVSFTAAQRAGFASQTFQVLVDGASVGTFAPTNSSYQALSTASFAVPAGSHTITFKGLNSVGDATAFLDAISITQDTSSSTAAFADASFEQVGVGTGSGAYVYNPTGSPWTFVGGAGLAGNGSAFTGLNATAPAGTQVAFLQNIGSISQTVAGFATGNYHLSFSASLRAGYANQTFQVLFDGMLLGTFAPTGASYQGMTTTSFAVTAGTHTITFKGLNTVGDGTVFIDGTGIIQDTTSQAVVNPFGDASFEQFQVGVGYNAYTYGPTGTPWVYTGTAGVSGAGSAFTNLTPAAPAGTQVAFLQNGGSISQTITNLFSGTYKIGFAAAQRPYFLAQTIQILVDGLVVGTFSNIGSSFSSLTTNAFALSLGTHKITFQGMNTAGDATAFIDDISLISQ